MNDVELYKKILGIENPWIVSDVSLNQSIEEITISVEYNSKKGLCPKCSKKCSIYDNGKSRLWRHLDTCQLKTYLSGSVPRINCPVHGVQSISIPWSDSFTHFTYLFQELAIVLLQATQNQTKAASILKISFKQLHLIMKKAVKLGLSRRKKLDIEYIGIDEKSMTKGHSYMTVVTDLKRGMILDIVEKRTKKVTKEVLENIKNTHNLLPLKAVSIDMWEAFMNATTETFPDADIVHDRFHIMKYLNDAVNKTRISENKELTKKEDDTLKKTKYLFLKNEENMTKTQVSRFEKLKELTLETSQAWRIKENFKGFFSCNYVNEAKIYLSQWLLDVKESSIKKMKKVAEMFGRHTSGLISYAKHKISNGIAENINGQIQRIKTVGRGFRKFENYKNAILFYLGKLDMNPLKRS